MAWIWVIYLPLVTLSIILSPLPTASEDTCPVGNVTVRVQVRKSPDASDDLCMKTIISLAQAGGLHNDIPPCETVAGALRAVQFLHNNFTGNDTRDFGLVALSVIIVLSVERHDVVNAILPCGLSLTITSENYSPGSSPDHWAVLDAGMKGRVFLTCKNSESSNTASCYKLAGVTLQNGLLRVTSKFSAGGGCMYVGQKTWINIVDCQFSNCTVQGNGVSEPKGGALHLDADTQLDLININRTDFVGNQLQVTNGNLTHINYHYTIIILQGSAVYSSCLAFIHFENCNFINNKATLNESSSNILKRLEKGYRSDEDAPDGIFLSGGAVSVNGGQVELLNSSFLNNMDIVYRDGSRVSSFGMDLTLWGSSAYLPIVFSHNSQINYLTIISGSLQSWLPSALYDNRLLKLADVAALSPQTLRIMSTFSEIISHQDLVISEDLVWLGGAISTPSAISLHGKALALSYQPTTCQLERLAPADPRASHSYDEQVRESRSYKNDERRLIIRNYGQLFLGGTFMSSFYSLELINYQALVTGSSFEILGLNFFNIFNYNTVTVKASFPLLKSYQQTLNGTLVVPANKEKKTCLGQKPVNISMFSKLTTLELNGTLRVTYTADQKNLCSVLNEAGTTFETLHEGYTLVSPVPIITHNLTVECQLADVPLEHNVTPFSHNEQQFWKLSVRVVLKDVKCSALRCSCSNCHWVPGCAWCTNKTNTSWSNDNSNLQGKCMPYSKRRLCNAKYFNEQKCCPNDCSGRGACHDSVCDCQWTWSGPACTKVSHAAVLIGIVGVSIVLTAIVIIVCLALCYRQKRHQISKSADEKVNSLSQRLLDAEGKLKGFEEESCIPQSFLISFDELKLEERIGSGGYGCVYRGVWRGSQVAVKQILGFHVEVDDTQQFYQEAQIMSSLHHPNIVLLMGVSLAAPNMCIVMEYMPHGSVYHLLKDETFSLDWRLRISMGLDAAKGMTYLHSSKPPFVHRDLKTPNLLVDNKFTVKVADFGVSKMLQRSKHHHSRLFEADGYGTSLHSFSSVQTGSFSLLNDFLNDMGDQGNRKSTNCSLELLNTTCIGSMRWSAPELVAKDSFVNQRAKYNEKVDVYSFGVILWELVSRSIPFPEINFDYAIAQAVLEGKRPETPHECPSAYSQLMQRCWSHEAKERPPFTEVVLHLQDMQLFFM